jgi:hypothetical protein
MWVAQVLYVPVWQADPNMGLAAAQCDYLSQLEGGGQLKSTSGVAALRRSDFHMLKESAAGRPSDCEARDYGAASVAGKFQD